MSEETKQADTGVAESELPDTWDEAAKPKADVAKEQPETSDDDADKPEGEADETAEAEEDESEGEDDRPKKPSRSERLRRQNERLRAENEALKSGSAVKAVEDKGALEAVIAQKVGPEPQEADYADWFAFERAMNAYEADKRTVTRQVKEQAETAKAAQVERMRDLADDYQDHLKAAAKELPDLMNVLKKATFVPTPIVEMLILEAGEKAPLVAYHLAQNPKAAASINAMSPVEAAREIGRIEGRVSIPKNKATRAPSPVTPVKGGASPSRGIGKSMSDYERWRNSGD